MNVWIVKYVLPVVAVSMLTFGSVHVLRSKPDADKLTPPANPARSSRSKVSTALADLQSGLLGMRDLRDPRACTVEIADIFRSPWTRKSQEFEHAMHWKRRGAC